MAKTTMRTIKNKWFNQLNFQELKEQAIEIAERMHKDPKYLLILSQTKNGEDSYVHCCHECGHKWTTSYQDSFCPQCKNTKTYSRKDFVLWERVFFRIAEIENAIVIAMVTSQYYYESNNDLSFKECTLQDVKVTFGLGIQDLEVCFQPDFYDIPKTYSFRDSCNKSIINELLNYSYHRWHEIEFTHHDGNIFHYPEEWGYNSVKDYLSAINSKIELERLNRRSNCKTSYKERNMVEVEDMPIPTTEAVEDFLTKDNLHLLQGKLLNKDFNNNAEWLYTCSCGYHGIVNNKLYQCPNNDTNNNNNTLLSKAIQVFRVELDSEKNLVWRQLLYSGSFENNEFVKKVSEVSRLTLLSTKKFKAVKYVEEEDGYWKKCSENKIFSDFPDTRSGCGRIMVSEEAEAFYEQSILKYSGCKEYWKDNPDDAWSLNQYGYLFNWIKKPFIEQIYKVGLTGIFATCLYRDTDNIVEINPNGTTIYDILKINKPVFKIAKALNLSLNALQAVKNLWAVDQTINEDLLKAFIDLPEYDTGRNSDFYVLGILNATNIMQQWSIRFKDVIEYLKNVYDYQCITPDVTIHIWGDYLNMCNLMSLHLSHSRKFPSSLKKEHDKMIFAYRAVREQIDKEKFQTVTESNRYLEKTPASEEFFIKIPSTPDEVVDEGSQQSHCVASYVNRIKNASSIIAFLRKKEEPAHSYFTLEIDPTNNNLIQCKGKGNCCLSDKSALEFIEKWAKTHNITINTRDLP